MLSRLLFIYYFLLLINPLRAQEADIVFLQTPASRIILPEGHTDVIKTVHFSPDARKFVTVSADGTAKVWETSSGKLLLNLKKQGEGESMPVQKSMFSPDGASLFVYHLGGYHKRLIQLKTGLDWNEDSITGPTDIIQFSKDGNNYVSLGDIYDVKKMKFLRRLKGIENNVLFEGFNPSGKTIVVCSQNDNSYKTFVRVFDIRTGLPLTANMSLRDTPREIRFSLNGQRLIMTSDSVIIISDANSLKQILQIPIKDKQETGLMETVLISPGADYQLHLNGKTYTDSSGEYPEEFVNYDSVTVKDIKTQKTIFTRNHLDANNLDQFDLFSLDGKTLLLPFADSTIQTISLANGQTLLTIKSWSGIIDQARFSANGKFILTVTSDHIIRTYQSNSNVMMSALKGHTATIYSACFSNDGSKVLSAGADMTARVWESSSGQPISVASRKTTELYGARFTPDGNKIVVETKEQSITWDIQAAKLEKPIDAEKKERGDVKLMEIMGGDDPENPGYKSPDGQYNILWHHPKSIIVTHLASGKQMFLWNGEMEHFTGVAVSPDSKQLLVTSEYNVMQLLDIRNGKVLFTFVLIDSSNFLVTNGKNHYDGTKKAREMIHFICGDEVIELSQVKEQLWVPGLAERIIAGDSINAVTLEQLNVCNKAPLLEDMSTDSLYRFRITPRTGGVGKTVVGLNGYDYREFETKDLTKTGTAYEIRIPASEMRTYFDETNSNQITVKSATAKNDLPSRTLTKTVYFDAGKKTAPNLFAVMVGTSNYKDDKMDLQFASADATKMASTLEESAGKLLGKEHVFVYAVTTDNQKLYPEKATIKNIFSEISKRAAPNDILLIFLSGHGVMNEKTKEFYYLTVDATSLVEENLFKNAGISMSELTEWIKPQSIKARKRVLILDACQSGQAINDMLAFNRNMLNVKGDEEARQIKAIERLNEKSGLYILSASASTQLAYESEEYGHGYLTYSLLKGIKENPAILEDGKYLNVTRWFNEAAEMVSELAKKDKSRQEPQVVSTSQFNIGLVDQELIQNIQLLSQKPLFIPGNFLNRDEAIADDNLGIRKMVDADLLQLSTAEGGKKIVFSTQSASPEAYSLNGSYLVREKEIDVKIRLKKGNATLFSYDLKGNTDLLPPLVKQITQQAMNWIAEQTKTANPADDQ
ncbi:MAG: caspase family protein [Chitinophagaceae bacterium]|nr:caspase family protein [Chitinophagaceae bacterium]